MSFHRKSALAASLVLLGLTAYGCGGDDTASPSEVTPDASKGDSGKSDGGLDATPDAKTDTTTETGTGGDGGDAAVDSAMADMGTPDQSVEAARDEQCVATDAGLDRPTLTDGKLAAPADATVVAHFFAVGDQVYTCNDTTPDGGGGDAGSSYTWVLKTPDATLYNGACMEVGAHYLGPTWWYASDGSSVKGAKVDSAASPHASSIPQLVLKAVSHDDADGGPGLLSDVTWIQRLDTVGGNPPPACAVADLGKELRVAYTATYYFYSGGTGDAGIVDGAAEGGGDSGGEGGEGGDQ